MNAIRHPGKKQFVMGLVLFAAVWFAGLIPLDRLFIRFLDRYNAEISKDTVIQYLGAGLVIFAGLKTGMRDYMGLGKPSPATSWLLIWPLIIMSVMNIPETFRLRSIGPDVFCSAAPYTRILFAFSAGLVEELLGRSMVAAGLLRMWGSSKQGVYGAALVSSVIFGAVHVGNYFVFNYTPLASLTQVLFALFFGIFFFALYARTKSVWPGIIMHALVDLCAHLDIYSGTSTLIPPSMIEFSRTPMQFLISMAMAAPLAIIGLVMLRKIQPDVG